MIITNNIVNNILDVQESWIFENYLKLDQKLIGQELCITSVFNPKERTPSLTIFFDFTRGRYFYKCFSSGRGGSANDLVRQLFPELTRAQVYQKVINDYKNYLKGNPPEERSYKKFNKYRVDSFLLRNWNHIDRDFWLKYGISSKLLERYNVAALQSFTMSKDEDNKIKTISISRDKSYGYFSKTGELSKIYNPGTPVKFIKVIPFIQGGDQLKFDTDNLIILSSMKDGLAFTALGIDNWTFVAPDSENVMVPKKDIEFLKGKYKNIVVLFDEDKAGKDAIKKYEDTYGLKGVYTTFGEKDISEAIEKQGQEQIKNQLIKLLNLKE